MKVIDIDGYSARCEAKGIERVVNLFLLDGQDLRIGDYVVVHKGSAREIISPETARIAWETYDLMISEQS